MIWKIYETYGGHKRVEGSGKKIEREEQNRIVHHSILPGTYTNIYGYKQAISLSHSLSHPLSLSPKNNVDLYLDK